MNENKHISKSIFYEVIEKRLIRYKEAIMGTRQTQGMEMAMSLAIHHNMQSLRVLDALNSLFGVGFWGYGINSISDGVENHSHHDVEVIRGISGLNKHHEVYRNLLLLSFKVENDSMYVSTFSIDSCSIVLKSNINRRYYLTDFQNATLKTRPNATFIDFIFKGIEKPISFQVDTYHFGGNGLSGHKLAKYYIDTIKELSNKFLLKKEPETSSGKRMGEEIDKIEKRLRNIVVETLCQKIGERDYEVLITGEAKTQIRSRIKEHVALHPNLQVSDFRSIDRAIQFCDIDHLKKVIIRDIYWNHFENVFKEKEKVVKYFEGFNNLRKAVMHNREMSMLIKHEGNAAIEWLNMAVF
ncbi:MAG: hypothetical protein ACT4OJ_12410 [Bacteroidota bacterium]